MAQTININTKLTTAASDMIPAENKKWSEEALTQ